METLIHIKELQHKTEWRYVLFYDYSSNLNNLIKNLPSAKYSATYKTWHFPLNEESKTMLLNFAKQHPFLILKKGITRLRVEQF